MWMAVAAMETRQGKDRASAGCPLQLGGIMVNVMCQLNWECTAQTGSNIILSMSVSGWDQYLTL